MRKPKLVIREVLDGDVIKYKPYLKIPAWIVGSSTYGVCHYINRDRYQSVINQGREYSSDLFLSEIEAIEGVKQFLLWRIEEWNKEQVRLHKIKSLKTIEIDIPTELINEIEKAIL